MPLWIIVIGLGYAAIYYFLFRWVITKWNLRTPGREDDDSAVGADPTADPVLVAEEKKAADADLAPAELDARGSGTTADGGGGR